MNASLGDQHCVPCEGGTKPLTRSEFSVYLPQVTDWQVSQDELSLSKKFEFADFAKAMEFVNQVAAIAQSEGHHPDIFLHAWKYVTLILSTHAIGGLSVNDFVLAVKINAIEHKI